MILYVLKFSACLTVFLIFYKLFLEKESIHKLKRGYLLVALVSALVIPFLTFTYYINVPLDLPHQFEQPLLITTPIKSQIVSVNYLPIILWSIYGLGVFVFAFKFYLNLNTIIYKIKHNPKQKLNGFTNVLLHNLKVPHTFFSFIFLNKQKFEKNEIPKEVFLHEQTHAAQKHSLDVLFIELLKVIFWFNPLIYFTRHLIKLNHEFLADQAVLENGISLSNYQKTLLQFTFNNTPQLVNAINYSLIKKRFTVMKTKTSRKSIWLRSLMILPLFAVLLYGFSDKVVVQKESSIAVQQIKFQEKIKKEGISEDMMKAYKEFMHSYKTLKRIHYPTYKRMVVVYDNMSKKQKESVTKYPKDPIPDSFNLTTKSPSKIEFNKWKNSKMYAIWIDGKNVNNDELNKYKSSDIAFYTGSFVHINARSKKHPQIYQYWIYTKKGFEVLKENLAKEDKNQGVYQSLDNRIQNVDKYKKIYKTFEALKDKSPHYIYKTKKEQIVLDDIFSQLGGMYFRMMRADKNNVNYPHAPIRPYVKFIKNGKEIYKKRSELTDEDLKSFPPPPPPKPKKIQKTQKVQKNKMVKYILIKIDKNNKIFLNDEIEVTLATITSEIKKITANYNAKQALEVRAVIRADAIVKMGFVNDVFEEAVKAGVSMRILK